MEIPSGCDKQTPRSSTTMQGGGRRGGPPPTTHRGPTLCRGWASVHGGQTPISLEYQICPPSFTIWYSSNWNAHPYLEGTTTAMQTMLMITGQSSQLSSSNVILSIVHVDRCLEYDTWEGNIIIEIIIIIMIIIAHGRCPEYETWEVVIIFRKALLHISWNMHQYLFHE